MKKLLLLLLLPFFMNAQAIKVMTYNIRLDVASDGENRWDKRKDFLAGQVQFYEPDVMGVQEATPGQMKYLDSIMEKYDFIGVGRDDGKDSGEYSAVFYNKEKFRVTQQSTFWLSETPNEVSFGWDAACRRVCTYGLFESKKTKELFWVFNTHFDHIGITARINSAKLIHEKIKQLNTKNLPVILTGDFNLEDDSESIRLIASQMNDLKKTAKSTFGPEGTFNNFEFDKPVVRRIDYIFTSKGVNAAKYAVLSDSKDCRYPSDHLPVYAEVELRK